MATYKQTTNIDLSKATFGEKSQGVSALQTYLNTKGANLKVDSMYGPKTQAAVAQYGLPTTDTGNTNVNNTNTNNTNTENTGEFKSRLVYDNVPEVSNVKSVETIQNEMRSAAQGEIDNLNSYYDTLVNESKVLGEKSLRSTNAISVMSGLSGSSEAAGAENTTLKENAADIKRVNTERAVAINEVLTKIRTGAVEEARAQREEARQSEQDRITYREKAQSEAVNNLALLAKSGSGASLEGLRNTLDENSYNTLVKNAGGELLAKAILFENRSKNTVMGNPTIVGNKMVQAYQTPEGKIKYEEVDMPEGINLNKIKSVEKTDNGIFIINEDGTYSKITGSGKAGPGAVDTSGLTTDQANDPFIKSILATKGGKALTDTSIQKLDKGLTVLGQLGVLQANVEGVKTGPIIGKFKGANPWDTNAQTIKASLNAIVPNLARGVYGEVGVLTDNDIKTYSKTLPNLTSTEAIRNGVLYITLDMIGKAIKNTLSVNAAAGRDVSGFADIYTEMESTKNSILSTIPGAQIPQAFKGGGGADDPLGILD